MCQLVEVECIQLFLYKNNFKLLLNRFELEQTPFLFPCFARVVIKVRSRYLTLESN